MRIPTTGIRFGRTQSISQCCTAASFIVQNGLAASVAKVISWGEAYLEYAPSGDERESLRRMGCAAYMLAITSNRVSFRNAEGDVQ